MNGTSNGDYSSNNCTMVELNTIIAGIVKVEMVHGDNSGRQNGYNCCYNINKRGGSKLST